MALQLTGSESGTQRWQESDGTAIEYRAPDGAVLRFEAFTSRRMFIQKRIGAKVTTTQGSKFEYAAIDSMYWVQAFADTYQIVQDSDTDTDDSYLDEYESKITIGIQGAFPARVQSLCRAQWRGARFAGVVAQGTPNLVTTGTVPDFPTGFPPDWSAPGGFHIYPRMLVLTARRENAVTTGRVTIRNRAGAPQTVTVHPTTGQGFHVDAGRITIAPDHPENVTVNYKGMGHATGSFVIDTPSAPITITLQGDVRSPLRNQP